MNEIRCATCGCVNVPERSRSTKNNEHLERPRGYCYCTYDGAKEAFLLRSNFDGSCKHGVGIGWSVGASDIPAIKTAPVWCPRKLMFHPLQTSYERLQKVIETRLPRGLVWALDIWTGKYIAVDNRHGTAVTREFETARLCKGWLNSLISVEPDGAQHEV